MNFCPIYCFSEAKPTTSTFKYLETVESFQIAASMYKLLTSCAQASDLTNGFDSDLALKSGESWNCNQTNSKDHFPNRMSLIGSFRFADQP